MEQRQDQQLAMGAVRNANSRSIFASSELCCQFLKEHLGA